MMTRRLTAIALVALLLPAIALALGGEMATLVSEPGFNFSHRQNVCQRYQDWREQKVELRDSLSGLSLHALMAVGDYFHYSNETGIDRTQPGLMAELMDALAERANFTWRSSFGIMQPPESVNKTWTEMLLWGIDSFDVAINWWDQSLERMEKGAAYIEPWFDGSIVLIDEMDPPETNDSIDLLNWTKPFENPVWGLIVITVLMSGLAYQLIEYLNGEREDRPMGQWFSDNLYLSSLNFTQNFEYAPNSVSGRIFGISMGIWALVITATYTANLASLFVVESRPALVVDSIDQAIVLGIPICTYENTNADTVIKRRYQNAIRVPMATELEAYQALKRGECGLVAGYMDNWLGYQGNSEYNPDCDLEWVGRTVEVIKSGFAVKADAGYKCSTLIREVMNIHMNEMIYDGVLDEVWERHRSKTTDQNCDLEESPSTGGERRRRLGSTNPSASRRRLKGAKAAAAGGGSDPSQSRLTLNQMLGTFFLHWVTTLIAILIALASKHQDKWNRLIGRSNKGRLEKVTYRENGPIIGSPPKMNTYRMTQPTDSDSDRSANPDDNQVKLSSIQEELFEHSTRGEQVAPTVATLQAEMQQTKKELDVKMDLVLVLLQQMRQKQPATSNRFDV